MSNCLFHNTEITLSTLIAANARQPESSPYMVEEENWLWWASLCLHVQGC